MSAVRRLMLSFFVRQSALHSDHIIAVSEFTRRELSQEIHETANKISVIYEAPQQRRIAATLAGGISTCPPAPYAVVFSSRSPHKNILRLVEAFRRARLHSSLPHSIVVIGHLPYRMVQSDDVICVGYQSDEVVARLLDGAEFLAFPSTYEGFGLPLLEAMAVGLAVTCSSAGSLPEIASDAALIFDPYSVESMEAAITRMATDSELRKELRIRAKTNLGRFSWDKTAQETLIVYEKLLDTRQHERVEGVENA